MRIFHSLMDAPQRCASCTFVTEPVNCFWFYKRQAQSFRQPDNMAANAHPISYDDFYSKPITYLKFHILSICKGLIHHPPPRLLNVTLNWNYDTFLESFKFRLCFRKLLKTVFMYFNWLSIVFEDIKISSSYAIAKSSWSCDTIDINSWKTLGVFSSPNDISLKINKLCWQVNTLFSLSFSRTCQYSNFKSNLEKYFADASDTGVFFVILLSTLKSTLNL